MTDAPLPARLAAAATVLANALHSHGGAPASDDALARLPPDLRVLVVGAARDALDAAAAVDEATTLTTGPIKVPSTRIALARFCALSLDTQAAVLIDVARDGTVWTTTWAVNPGTPSVAITEWAHGLRTHALGAVPFRTVFGMGCGGRPTPLTADERARLTPAQVEYADRLPPVEAPRT